MNILRKSLALVLSDSDMPDNVTNDEWKFTVMLLNLLEPMRNVTEIIGGKNYSTISQCL